MSDLKNRPEDFIPFLAFVRGILGIAHLVAEFEKCIFEVFEAVRGRFTIPGGAYGGHGVFYSIL